MGVVSWLDPHVDRYVLSTAGEEKVVAGSFKNKLQAVAGRILPDRVKAAATGKQEEPGGAS